MEKLYRPTLFFFLLPIFYILSGSMFALQYNSFNFLSFLFFYFYILINQMLENIFLRIPKNEFQMSNRFILLLEILNIVLIGLLGWRHSWLTALFLALFTIIIQSQFLFSYYHLDNLAAFISSSSKVLLLNSFAFYIHANFIHQRYIIYFVGLLIPFYLYEATRLPTSFSKKWLLILTGLGYVISITFLWQLLGWRALFILLSLPFCGLFFKEFNRKTTAIYATIFAILYIGLNVLGIYG